MLDSYRKNIKQAILNTNMTDANKLKSIDEANDIIDSKIIETIIKQSEKKEINLTNLIKEIDQSAKVTRDGISYNVKDVELSSLVNSLRKKKNNLTEIIKDELDAKLQKNTLQSN